MTFKEIVAAIDHCREAFPNMDWSTDNDGKIIIYTNEAVGPRREDKDDDGTD